MLAIPNGITVVDKDRVGNKKGGSSDDTLVANDRKKAIEDVKNIRTDSLQLQEDIKQAGGQVLQRYSQRIPAQKAPVAGLIKVC